MGAVDVVAVVGTCAPERRRYAKRLSITSQRASVGAVRLAVGDDAIGAALDVVPWIASPAGAVVEFPTPTDPIDIIGALTERPDAVRLVGLVAVVDAAHVLADLRAEDTVAVPNPGGTTGSRSRAGLLVRQIEYASLVLLVNWDSLSTPALSSVMALMSHLSPQARLRLHRATPEPVPTESVYTAAQERAGWVRLLNGEFEPHMTDPHIDALHYERLRPMHPERLHHALSGSIGEGRFGTIVRSAGFCRLATRPRVIASWDHVGAAISLDPLAFEDDFGPDDDPLALGQDLAFIGIDLATDRLRDALDATLLTDEELSAGPAAWSEYPDPFPVWETEPDPRD